MIDIKIILVNSSQCLLSCYVPTIYIIKKCVPFLYIRKVKKAPVLALGIATPVAVGAM